MAEPRSTLAKLYRVAFLAAEVTLPGADAPLAAEAAALAWVACIEAVQRHPGVSVLDPAATPLVAENGHFAPRDAARGAVPTDARFAPTRRDELVWLEATIAPGDRAARVAVHTIDRAGHAGEFVGTGATLGAQVTSALGEWLTARGLAPLPKLRAQEALTADDVLACVRAIGPLLAERARAQGQIGDDIDPDAEVVATDHPAATARPPRAPTQGSPDTSIDIVPLTDPPPPSPSRAVALQLPTAFRVPALRLLELALGEDFSELVLAADREHPQALFARYLAGAEPDRTLLRRIVAAAPGWTPGYIELLASDEPQIAEATLAAPAAMLATPPSALELTAAAAMATVCRPASLEVLSQAADRLAADGRVDDGIRLLERAVAIATAAGDPDAYAAHIALVDLLGRSERDGERLARAQAASLQFGCASAPGAPRYADQLRVDLRLSTALVGVGRLAEAIALRGDRLAGREVGWSRFASALARWRTDPQQLAWSYAREGGFRGDDTRAVEGFGRARIGDDLDLARYLDALVATGREDEAVLAWAQFGGSGRDSAPAARLAAARALIAAGDWRRGLDQLWRVELAEPTHDDQVALAHIGRGLANAPIDLVESAIAERLAAGAVTLARRMARTVADFVGGANKSIAIGRALAKPTAIEFDPAWLAEFGPHTRSKPAIDAFFAELGAPRKDAPRPRTRVGTPTGGDASTSELARADRLVNRWCEAAFASAPATDSDDGAAAIAQAAAYTAAHALARYLALTTQPPTIHAGALRTVAAEALALVRRYRAQLSDRDAHALLGALDAPLRRADRWVGGTWLATVERALALDERSGGDLAGFAQPHATIAARVLGPEEVAMLSMSVARLHRERGDGWASACAVQAERLAYYAGRTGTDEWAAAVATQLADRDRIATDPGVARGSDVDDAIDALQTACYLAEGKSPVACVHAARTLLEAGRASAAVAVLTAGLPCASRAWRDRNLAPLAPLWEASRLDLPFAFEPAQAAVVASLQAREPARAEKLGRWAIALAPDHAESQRNLGLACAQQGKLADAVAHLCRGTPEHALELIAGVLEQRGKFAELRTVLDYASLEYATAGEWIGYARLALAAADHARAERGFATALALDAEALDASALHAYASVLADTGAYDACAAIADRLAALAAQAADPRWTARAAHVLARARIGQRRFADAIALAERALAALPASEPGDARSALAATLANAQSRRVPSPQPAMLVDAHGRPRERVFDELDAGELAAAAAQVGSPIASWRVRRAALAASRYREPIENALAVTRRAAAAALAILIETVGLVERDAVTARALALRIREQSLFARDPVPQLGERMTRDQFHRELRERGGTPVVAATPATPPPTVLANDRVGVPGGKLARVGDYVALVRDLGALAPRDALAKAGLDDDSYLEVARAWTAALAADASLAHAVADAIAAPTG